MDDEKKYWVGFSVFPGIGPIRFALLRRYFRSVKSAWFASNDELVNAGLGTTLSATFLDFRSSFDIDRYTKQLQDAEVFVITAEEKKYPVLLSHISDPPFVLYGKGKKTHASWDITRSIGVVGARKMTNYGKAATVRIVRGLVDAGCTIVSGMAYGIDATAHKTTIEYGGKTIAVLGCGVDIVYPAANLSIYQKIIEGSGVVLSEMPLSLRPVKGVFTARNRIISGLSKGVVVIEGTEKSGTLITARYALEQGREVYAVPGPITSSYSKATSILIKQGAKLVESADDILEDFPSMRGKNTTPRKKPVSGDTKEERVILELLSSYPMHIDEIIRQSEMASQVVSATLTVLEMKGVVRDIGDKVYGRVAL